MNKHISVSQIDYAYIKSALFEEFHTKVIFPNIRLSDYDGVRIVFQKKYVDFNVSK